MEQRRILLLGATGYTGQRVLRELLARGQAPTWSGEPGPRCWPWPTAWRRSFPVAEVEVTSTADLARLLEPSDVVLSTVGPFMQLGMATVTAAAQAGAHYLDSAGEGSFVRRVFELDAVAAARGASVVPAFGYDYVPGNLAGALALTRAGERARGSGRLLPHPIRPWGRAALPQHPARRLHPDHGGRAPRWSRRRPRTPSPTAAHAPGLPPG